MTKFLWFLALIFALEVHGRIIFESVNLKFNADYGEASVTIDKSPIGPILNMDANITKTLFGKLFAKLTVFSFNQKRKRLIMPLPKFNYCEIQSDATTFPIVKNIYEELQKYGNLTSACPFQPANYYLKDFQFDDAKLSATTAVVPEGKYIVHVDVTDENEIKPIIVASVDVCVVFKKNKN